MHVLLRHERDITGKLLCVCVVWVEGCNCLSMLRQQCKRWSEKPNRQQRADGEDDVNIKVT